MKPDSLLPFLVLGLVSTARAPLTAAQASPPARGAHGEAVLARPVVFEGVVYGPDGVPAEGAVVVSSAGERAVTDAAGGYRLTVEVPQDTTVQITALGVMAFGQAPGRSLGASTQVMSSGALGSVRVDPLALSLTACAPSWLPTFGERSGTNGTVYALAVFDDGIGSALYAGGAFTTADEGVSVNRVARWDGTSWTPLGDGMDGTIHALLVHDDGGGPALYAGGFFTTAGGTAANGVARWDGASWSALGDGTSSGVWALAVYDDGTGSALYAGGAFSLAGGDVVRGIAKWDGSGWSALASGLDDGVKALAVFDDGSGPALFVGGYFDGAPGTPFVHASLLAKWDGSSWSGVGGGIVGYSVEALTVHDDGSGPALYVGGLFDAAGGVPVEHLARWDGSSWSAVGGGRVAGWVYNLYTHDDGSGPALFAGGSHLEKWDGVTWTLVEIGVGWVQALSAFDDGSGSRLYAGGTFEHIGEVGARNIAAWDGTGWTGLGSQLDGNVSFAAGSLVAHDDGSGSALYFGGSGIPFVAGGVVANGVARWNGTGWSTFGDGLYPPEVESMVVHDEGAGPVLFAGGGFLQAGSLSANHIARWDGTSWSALGSGMNNGVRALAVHDDGSGPALFAAGSFTTAGGVPAARIARWDGTSWSPLGTGIDSRVNALAVHDDGNGAALFAAGGFTSAGGAPAHRIAKWDGSTWAALGKGLDQPVFALATYDDGSGPALYAGGNLLSAGGVPANRIARWDGSSWSPLAGGLNGSVLALEVHDDGNGPALFVAGRFTAASGVAANRIARWNGTSWSALGGGMNDAVWELVVYDAGSEPSLFASGLFTTAFDSGEAYLARWGYADVDLDPPTLSYPAVVYATDRLGSPPGEVVDFTVTANDCRDPAPGLVCVPPSGSFFPLGTTLVTCTATDAAGNQASAQFPVTVLLKARRR